MQLLVRFRQQSAGPVAGVTQMDIFARISARLLSGWMPGAGFVEEFDALPEDTKMPSSLAREATAAAHERLLRLIHSFVVVCAEPFWCLGGLLLPLRPPLPHQLREPLSSRRAHSSPTRGFLCGLRRLVRCSLALLLCPAFSLRSGDLRPCCGGHAPRAAPGG